MVRLAVSRQLLTRWVLPLCLVLAILFPVWLAGGFRPADRLAGPRAELGETLELRRWTITVHRVALVDTSLEDYEQDPAFRVWARIVLTDDESQDFLPDGLIGVRVPGEPQPGTFGYQNQDRGMGFDPDVPREVIFDYKWPDADEPRHLPAPDTVTVVVRDERWSYNYVWGDELKVGDPAGLITVPVDDRRKRS